MSVRHKKVRLSLVILLTSVVISCNIPAANAIFVMNQFGGNVVFVSSGLTSIFDATQTFSGAYSFDSSAADEIPSNPDIGAYSLLSFSVVVSNPDGSVVWSANLGPGTGIFGSSGSHIVIFNDDAAAGVLLDRYVVGSDLSGPSVGALVPENASFDLRTPFTTFDDDSLPLDVSFPIASSSFGIGFIDPDDPEFPFNDQIIGGITSIEQIEAPEPSTLVLFATGLALLVFLGYRWRRVMRSEAA